MESNTSHNFFLYGVEIFIKHFCLGKYMKYKFAKCHPYTKYLASMNNDIICKMLSLCKVFSLDEFTNLMLKITKENVMIVFLHKGLLLSRWH